MTQLNLDPGQVISAASALRSTLRGDVVRPGDDAYAGARQIWNGAIGRRPAVIVHCADGADVAAAVRITREHELPLSVRGGGHDWVGRALREGGVTLDLGRLRQVGVDPDAAVATAQGGARAGDVITAADRYGLAPATGTAKAVGMAGLTLGGGYGVLNGACGLALDNLLSAEVVLPDGSQVHAGPDSEPDLFWALRGGGGNFGIVTSAAYRLHRINPLVSGMLLFPLEQAASVLHGYRDLLAEAPDELTVMAGFISAPDGNPLVFLLPTWLGQADQGIALIARLATLGQPVSAMSGPGTYLELVSQFDDAVTDGRYNEMRTHWLAELTDATVDRLIAAASVMTSPYSAVFLHHFHGAAARVPVPDTAFALRRDHLLIEILASWVPDDDATGGPDDYAESGAANRHQNWARSLATDLAEVALPGGYPNLLGDDEPDRVLAAYGPNAARLLELKRRVDPDGILAAVPTLPKL